MFINFLKVSIRNLIRHKSYSLINIIGLSIGMACSIIIALFVFDELSYDKYNENYQQIYRLGINGSFNGQEMRAYRSGSPDGPVITSEVPEIKNFARVISASYNEEEILITYEDKSFLQERAYFADSTYFDIFTCNFIEGDPQKALANPNSLVLTESAAVKIFGNKDVMGKMVNMLDEEYTVTAIIEDCPSNTHFHYSMLASLVSIPAADFTTWLSNDYATTYFLIDENADINLVKKKVNDVAKSYAESELESGFGIKIEEFYKSGNYFEFLLQPIERIHLHSHTNFEIEPNSNIIYVYIFSIIAVFILIIACVNFMNLSTARSATRAKEVGVRKVVGATKRSLFNQFILESIVISVISLFIAMIIVESILPVFNNLSGKALSVGYSSNIVVIPLLLLLALFVGVFSGLYSASYLSSIKILSVFKGSLLSGKSQSWFRNVLVVFQFTISIGLFISTFIIYDQINLLKNKDVGFNKENVLLIERSNALRSSSESFKQELMKLPNVKNVTFSNTIPSGHFSGFPCSVEGDDASRTFVPRILRTDYDYADAYDLKLKEGRFFSREFSTDSFALIINEAAAKDFGFQGSAVGKHIITNYGGEVTRWPIIGVVENFNFNSLYQDVGPLVLLNPSYLSLNYTSVRFTNGLNQENIQRVQQVWDKYVANAPFKYSILEDEFNSMHKEEFRTGQLFGIFSVLTIFIACLGLLGLASFIAQNKTKEIGIRKALGASVFKVTALLLKQFTFWVVIANIIAWPVAYFAMHKWLQNFAYKVDIQWWVFIVSAALGLLIAVVTVSYQAITAAQKNPVDSLRYE
ncbi:MAG: ABC transporter permease [Bacteroidetes bacterium]|nr:ABC transporter permease [Bacteroidota bacterium]